MVLHKWSGGKTCPDVVIKKKNIGGSAEDCKFFDGVGCHCEGEEWVCGGG